jgi:hypothetical protein
MWFLYRCPTASRQRDHKYYDSGIERYRWTRLYSVARALVCQIKRDPSRLARGRFENLDNNAQAGHTA